MKESLLSRFFNNKIIVFVLTASQIIYLIVLYTLKTEVEQNKALILVRKNIFLNLFATIVRKLFLKIYLHYFQLEN